MGLPGVKIGPLDPDATSEFGQVAQRNSARQLIRLHSQMYPPHLKRALARPRDEGHTNAVMDALDGEVLDHVRTLEHDNGDPVLPEGSRLVGAAVRGDRSTGRVLTVQYELKSGRVGKWFTDYTPELLPGVFESGEELSRRHKLRERGIVAFDDEGARSEILQRQLNEARREARALRAFVEAGSQGDAPEGRTAADVDIRDGVNLADENERLGRENQEMRERLGRLEALVNAQAGGVPTGGLEADIPGGGPLVAAEDPPFEGYENLKADELVGRLKDADTSHDEVRAILEYERSHQNRKSVVSAGEQRLDTTQE